MSDPLPPADKPARAAITLDTPLPREGGALTTLEVRRPRSGELRGLSMSALLNLDYAALETLLPRITIPTLTRAEVAALTPADLVQLGGEVMDFLLPKAVKAKASRGE